MKPLVISSLLLCLLLAALGRGPARLDDAPTSHKASCKVASMTASRRTAKQVRRPTSTFSHLPCTGNLPPMCARRSHAYREPPPPHRTNFYPVSIAALRAGKARHTHVHISGQVTGVIDETDGDIHVWLCDENARGARDPQHCINAEIIPEFPLRRPKVGSMVRLNGISRFDPEHRWFELHPVLAIETIPGETK
jgi:hypothetical protein